MTAATSPQLVRPPTQPARTPQPPTAQHSTADDLPTRIHEDISNHLYDCVICSNEVLRTSHVWSCSACFVVLHLRCVQQWHATQMDTLAGLTWRCPGCNTALTDSPEPYSCWCGKERPPKFVAGLPPHSCGQTCSKVRGGASGDDACCPHPCMLQCHAGPCPPCTRMAPPRACHCGKSTRTRRCGDAGANAVWSCDEICGDVLACGEHECPKRCHGGFCGDCRVRVDVWCYCGKEERIVRCCDRDLPVSSFRHHRQEDAADQDSGDDRRR